MGQFQVTTKPLSEVKSKDAKPPLPAAQLKCELVENDGKTFVLGQILFELPDEDLVRDHYTTERKGKKTKKVDNSDKVVSVYSLLGKLASADIVVMVENPETKEQTEVALTDSNGNQMQLTSKMFIRVKGEGAEDLEADEDEDED